MLHYLNATLTSMFWFWHEKTLRVYGLICKTVHFVALGRFYEIAIHVRSKARQTFFFFPEKAIINTMNRQIFIIQA